MKIGTKVQYCYGFSGYGISFSNTKQYTQVQNFSPGYKLVVRRASRGFLPVSDQPQLAASPDRLLCPVPHLLPLHLDGSGVGPLADQQGQAERGLRHHQKNGRFQQGLLKIFLWPMHLFLK
jgi:hypothetical protein